MADNKAEIVIDGNATGFRRAMQEVVAISRSGAGQIEGAFGGLNGALISVQTAVAGLVAAFSGISLFGVRAAVDAVDALNDVSDATGASVEAISGLQDTARRTGTTLDVVETSLIKLNQALNDAEPDSKQAAALRGIGLSVAELRKQDPAEALVSVAKALDGYTDSGNKARYVQALFGKSLREVAPLLHDLAERGRGAATVSQEQARQAELLNQQIFAIQTTAGNAARALLLSFVPALSEVAEFTRRAQNEMGPFLGLLAGIGGGVYKALGGTLDELKRAESEVQGLFDKRAARLKDIEALTLTASSAVYAVTRDEAKKELEAAQSDLRDITAALNVAIAARNKLQEAARTGGKPPAKQDLPPLPGGPKSGASDPSLMAYYEAALSEEKRLASERDALREYSKQEELAYWQTLLQYADLNTKDRVAIEKKASDLAVAIARDEAKQKLALQGETARHQEAMEMGTLDARKAAARTALDLDQITKAQYLQIEEEFENQRWEIQRAALEERMKLLEADPNTNPVEYARLKNQILELEQQHQLALQNIQGQQAKEGQQEGGFFGGVVNSFGRGLQTMLTGAQSWRDSMVQILGGVRDAAAQEVGRMVTTWLFGETAKTGATKVGAAVRLATETGAALQSVGLWASAAIKNIMNSAWEAMAGAWKAIVGIPYIGPVLAPVAAGAAFAGVAALAGHISSAAGGYDIPRGLNPITQLHEQEMVLPKPIANPLREMLASGGQGQGGAANVRIINATDPAIVRDWMRGPEGTQVITNVIRANPELLRAVAIG